MNSLPNLLRRRNKGRDISRGLTPATKVSQPVTGIDGAAVKPPPDSYFATLSRTNLGTWAIAIALVLLSWPVPTLAPGGGSLLDRSWQVALVLAAEQDLQHGSDIAFTYGPLGHLGIPPKLWTPKGAASAILFTAVAHILLVRTLLHHVMRLLPAVTAIGVVWLIHAVMNHLGSPEVVAVTIFLGAASIVHSSPPGRPALWAAMGASLSAALLLVKFSAGVTAAGILCITVLAVSRSRMRALVLTGTLFAATLGGLWVFIGQSLKNLLPWLHASLEMTIGYSEAMSIEDAQRTHEYAVGVALLAVMAVLLWRERDRWHPWPALLIGWMIYVSAKQGFVRHDGHSVHFFILMAVLPLTLRRASMRLVVPLATAAITAAMFSVGGPAPPPVLTQAVRAPERLINQGSDVLYPSRRSDTQAQARSAMALALGIPAEVLTVVRTGDVHVRPYNAAAVWVHELKWNPLPVFQGYAAYTARLDALNADTLRSPDAPEFILQERVGSIDTRYAAYEAPRENLAVYCHYREKMSTSRWLVLRRSTSRCQEPQLIARVEAHDREPIPVPIAPPGSLVYASVHLGDLPALEAGLHTLFKPLHHLHISLDGAPARRLVRATVAGPLLLRVPTAGDPIAGLLPDPAVDTIRLDNLPSGSTVSFYRLSMTDV